MIGLPTAARLTNRKMQQMTDKSKTTTETAQERHQAFTLGYYDRSPSSDLRAVISAHGDAAHMCDAIAADIRREHTVKRGWKSGQVSDAGEAMASAVERAGDAIWAVHEALRKKAEQGVQE